MKQQEIKEVKKNKQKTTNHYFFVNKKAQIKS